MLRKTTTETQVSVNQRNISHPKVISTSRGNNSVKKCWLFVKLDQPSTSPNLSSVCPREHTTIGGNNMATKKARTKKAASASVSESLVASSVDEMLLGGLERGADSLETGRYLITFKEGAAQEASQSLGARGMRVADARDFKDQDAVLESVGDADAMVFPEIGVALVSGGAAQERGLSAQAEVAADSPIASIDPELFVFAAGTPARNLTGFSTQAENAPSEYLRGFIKAAETIANDLRLGVSIIQPMPTEEEAVLALGATWGLNACRVPPSARSGVGLQVAVLDTGMDLGHPDFAGRPVVSQQFVGQPVQDLHSHGTHCIRTACGPLAPAGNTPRYGIAYRSLIFVGKVLSNSGTSVGGS